MIKHYKINPDGSETFVGFEPSLPEKRVSFDEVLRDYLGYDNAAALNEAKRAWAREALETELFESALERADRD